MAIDPKRVQAAFLEVVAAEPAERAGVLDRVCAGDAELRRRVELLLRAHDDSGELPSAGGEAPGTSAFEPGTADAAPASDLQSGALFAGRYKLREKLGEGGMGVVWVADQIEPVQRRVALKVIKTAGDSRRLLARFEQERQALALMDHPNIAKVFDAGIAGECSGSRETSDSAGTLASSATGCPYFVMELIKGVPLTKYCDEAKLTPKQRLELFVPVCHAVQHAHQKGIIHRDLKPSNILIGLYDGRPVPKIIDFGVAKATGPQISEHSIYTEVGAMIGTLEYMSPEQAELNNLDIDTRSDIYALGVILYELLTGGVPFSHKELKAAGFAEMLRIIKEVEPPKPSTRLSGSGTLPSVAAARHTEPSKLTRLVRGELDWIVMKCLEKDRGRRYETANGLAMDIQRFLTDEPVAAGPPSAAYRLRKFVRRNKPQVIAATLVFVALLAGIAGTTFGLIRANRAAVREADERMKAEAAKTEAQAKEAEANAVVKFFQLRVFAAARPKGQEGGLGAGVTMRDAIAAGEKALDRGFAAQPLVEARLRMSLGATFHYLAEHDLSRIQFERAQALFTQNVGPDHPDTLVCMNNLANSYAALNRHAEALKLHEEGLAIRKQVLPKDHPDTLVSMINLANCYAALNRPTEALNLREEVLLIQKQVLPSDHPDTLRSMNNLANSYLDLNRPTEARRLLEEVLAIQKRVQLLDHPETLRSMHNLANSYLALNRRAEALNLREEVLTIQKRVLPPDHPDTLKSMHNLALSYAALNRHADALPLVNEVLAKANRPGIDPRLAPIAIFVQLQCCQKANDPAGCRTSAEMWEKLNRPDAGSLYNAACYRAVTAAVQAKTPGADAARLARDDADKAMAWLTKAVAAGYKDAVHMKKDTDLDSLRGREDFKKLLADLEAKSPPPQERK